MMFVYSCSAEVASSLGFRQHEIGEVFEDPVLFQCLVDDAEKLACQGDDRLAGATSSSDAFVISMEKGTVTFSDQGALDEGRTPQFASAFGNVASVFGFIGVLDAGHDTEVSGQLAFPGEVVHVPDH